MPHVEYDKGKIEEIQRILCTLNAPTSLLDENLDGELALHLAPVDPHGTATTFVPESGTTSAMPPPIFYGMLITPRSFLLSQLQHSSLWTFNQARFRSA